MQFGCQKNTSYSPPDSSYQIITFNTPDQVSLSGRIFGLISGNPVIVLAHGDKENQESWNQFVDVLVANNYTVMTFNFRGTSPSKGKKDQAKFDSDIRGALTYLESQGVMGLAIIGSGSGATAAIQFSATQSLLGIIALSPLKSLGELNISPFLTEIDNPILFIVSEGDESAHQDAADMFHAPHKGVWAISIFRGDSTGTGLLTTNPDDGISEHILQYVDGFIQ